MEAENAAKSLKVATVAKVADPVSGLRDWAGYRCECVFIYRRYLLKILSDKVKSGDAATPVFGLCDSCDSCDFWRLIREYVGDQTLRQLRLLAIELRLLGRRRRTNVLKAISALV